MAWAAAPWAAAKVDGGCGLLLKLTIAYPQAATLYFSDSLIFDATIAGNASVGMAASISVKGIEIGLGNPAEFVIDVANIRYHSNAANQSDPPVYGSLAHLMSKYPLIGSTVEITEYAKAAGTQESRRILAGTWTDGSAQYSGYVANVTDITADSIKLIVRQCQGLDMGGLPRYSIGTHERPSFGFDRGPIAEMSRGLYVPVGMNGTLSTFIPPNWESVYYTGDADLWKFMQMGSFAGGLIPARRSSAVGEETFWAAQENMSGNAGTDAYTSYGYTVNECVFKLVDGKHLARVTNVYNGINDGSASVSRMYKFTTKRPSEMVAYILPTKLSRRNSDAIEYEKAIDGRLDTYMTIASNLHGQPGYVRFEMPSLSNLGRILPADGNLKLFAYTAMAPPGNIGAPVGSFRLGIWEPSDKPTSGWQFGTPGTLSTNYTGFQYPRTDDNAYVYPPYLRVGTGWVGTQWQEWNFTASGSNATNDLNARVFVGEEYAGKPFELAIQWSGTARFYIIALGIVCTFQEGIDGVTPMIRQYENVGRSPKGTPGHRHYWEMATVRESNVGIRRDGSTMWGRGRAEFEAINKPIEQVDPEGWYLLFPGYKDTTNTYGGGLNERIEYPGSIIQWIGQHYSEPPTKFTIGDVSTAGSIVAFQSILDAWATYGGSSSRYRMQFRIDERQQLGAAIDGILSECPGIAGTGVMSNPAATATAGRPALYAMGPLLSSDAVNRHSLATGGLSVHNHILKRPNGSPAVEIMTEGLNPVVNDLEIHYQYDPVRRTYGRIASVNSSGEDDGYSGAWPTCVGSGMSAQALCAASEQYFGKRKKQIIKLGYVKDRDSAIGFGISKLWTMWRPQARVRALVTMAGHSIVPGQYITFNDDLYTLCGQACPVMFRNSASWSGFYWVVTNVTRHDGGIAGGGVFYEILAVEHLNDKVGYSTLAGGPAFEPVGEGFDV